MYALTSVCGGSLSQPSTGEPLWRAQQIRDWEPRLAQAGATDLAGLMSRAGRALFTLVRQRWPWAQRIWIYCGAGNNGGDGYELASLLREAGCQVTVIGLGAPRPNLAAHGAWRRWLAQGQVHALANVPAGQPDLVVDALLGIGPSQMLQGPVVAHIAAINAHSVPVLAVDLPSGLAADTGLPLGAVVRAACTLTFIGCKRGLLTGQAAEWVGELWVDGLDLPPLSDFTSPDGLWLDYSRLSGYLRRRPRHQHKGDNGRLLLVGGGPGMPGALRLAAESALRGGAGLVKVAPHPDNLPLVAAGRPELMFSLGELPDWPWPTACVIGPGLGLTAWSGQLFAAWLAAERPSVVDADALTLLALSPLRRDNWILTPHPGEAARLLDCGIDEVQRDRFAAVTALQARYGGVVLLKGPGTLICDGTGIWVCGGGNPGMASGGMGDLLAGLIGALWVQGYSPLLATQLGVCMHGAAGDLAAQAGERGMVASDLLPHIRQLANRHEDANDKHADNHLEL